MLWRIAAGVCVLVFWLLVYTQRSAQSSVKDVTYISYLVRYMRDLKQHKAFLAKSPGGHECCTHPMPAPWRTDLCFEGAPDWILNELWSQQDRPQEFYETSEEASKRCQSNISTSGTFSKTPPEYSLNLRKVIRVPVTEMSGLAFIDNFASRGIPVVLTGAHLSDENWTNRRSALQKLDPSHDSFVHSDKQDAGVSRYCNSPECGEAGQLHLGAFSPAFDVPSPLPGLMFDKASPFFGRTGDLFAIDKYHPSHFDMTCSGIISVQYSGRKKWYLWAPSAWQIPLVDGTMLQPHTPMETVLEEGDMLFFMPGWYHATEVLEGPSIAVSHHTSAPIYGDILEADMQVSPFGFQKCFHDPYGWKTGKEAWDMIRERGNVSLPKALKPEYVPNAYNFQPGPALETPAIAGRLPSKLRMRGSQVETNKAHEGEL